MAAGQLLSTLSTVPSSYGLSLAEQRQPRQLKKHGREYSVQLDIGDKPVDHTDSKSPEEVEGFPSLPAAEHCHPPSPPPTEDPPLEKKLASLGEAQEYSVTLSEPSPEELFARRFGYSVSTQSPPSSITPSESSKVPLSRPRPRPRSIQRRPGPFSDDEEGSLVVLPSPPLLRPASFWRNTRRSALHTPSLHLVRRATFLAAGLALDKPVCDLSAFAVESRITVGKTKGLGGSAGVPVGWGVFG